MTQTSLSDAGTVSDETREHWRQAGRVARHLLPSEARSRFDPVVNGVADEGEDDEYAVNVEFHFNPAAITTQLDDDADAVETPTLRVSEWHDNHDVTVAFEEFSATVDSTYGSPGQRVTVRAVFPSGVQYRIHIGVFVPDE